jgi:lipoprotein-anchoring transpeptidase ErfK/SrfK
MTSRRLLAIAVVPILFSLASRRADAAVRPGLSPAAPPAQAARAAQAGRQAQAAAPAPTPAAPPAGQAPPPAGSAPQPVPPAPPSAGSQAPPATQGQAPGAPPAPPGAVDPGAPQSTSGAAGATGAAPGIVEAAPFPPPPADPQILLDRIGYSPGVIDGSWGENSRKAVAAFQQTHALPVTSQIDRTTWDTLLSASGGGPVAVYTITPADANGPFYQIPPKLEEQASLPALGYASLMEMLGERFHCGEKLLRQLNPNASFAAGETIRVPNIRLVAWGGATKVTPADLQITVSKSQKELTVTSGGRPLFFAPVSAGSEHDPLPLGTWKVRSVVRNPVFHYDPALFWNGNPADSKATLAAGPNNPVGVVWIDLSKDHYGIHGTPNPASIGTAFSHGCVRLTNWDALTVASLVRPGTPVVFTP